MLASLAAAFQAARSVVTTAQTPNVALLHRVPTPYWQHLHRAIRQSLPGVTVWSLYTHANPDQPWELSAAHDVRPVSFAEAPSEPESRLARMRRELRTATSVIRWLEEHRVNAVVLYGYADLTRLRVLAWCKLHGVAAFMAADSNIRGDRQRAVGLKGLVKKMVVTSVVKSCDGVMPFGTCGAEYFRKYGADDAKIFPVPGGPDYAQIRSVSAEDSERALAGLGLERGRRRLVFSGRLIGLKRVDLLIDAFARLADRRPDWDLLIIGDGPERAALEARVPERLRGRVAFAGFVNDGHTLASLYRACDAMVLPSNSEAWGLVLNEALACGLAVVASDVVGAAADLIVDGYNGRVFANEDLDSLTDALSEVTHSTNIDRMRANSPAVLASYRFAFDPIEGLRNALRTVGLLPRTVEQPAVVVRSRGADVPVVVTPGAAEMDRTRQVA
ncbi:MAG: glycosyltransferase family 4 protein [Phycisphaeraceae bacterium]|nr:glycosyltransferase family 4 protein [Phycisphaeraceae bacterium]